MGGITHPNQYFDLSMKFYNDIHAAEQAADGKAGSQLQPLADDQTQSQEPATAPMPMATEA
jgi:hypothetical protein